MTASKNSSTSTAPEPPAQAVAADAHWAAKMEKLRNRGLVEDDFVICDDPQVRDRYLRAKRALELAQTYARNSPDDPEAQAELDRATAEHDAAKAPYDEAAIRIRFRALPRQSLEQLYKQHKPSEAEAEDGATWSASFPPALIAAASVDGMTEQDAQELLDTWSLAEANAMFNAAHGLQHTVRADLGKG